MNFTFKKALILMALVLTCNLYGQSKKQNYMDHNLTSITLLEVMAKAVFQPISYDGDPKKFKTTTLQLPDNVIKQLNIDAWYLCTNKIPEYLQIYNIHYEEVSREFFEKNCKELIALMILDDTISQPR